MVVVLVVLNLLAWDVFRLRRRLATAHKPEHRAVLIRTHLRTVGVIVGLSGLFAVAGAVMALPLSFLAAVVLLLIGGGGAVYFLNRFQKDLR
jgi:hypothetical protein